MDMKSLRSKAADEEEDISDYIKMVSDYISKHPTGMDIYIPKYVIPKLEKYCDDNHIPFYHLYDTTCSVARTYTQLYEYEDKR
jgi:hypothetical protein